MSEPTVSTSAPSSRSGAKALAGASDGAAVRLPPGLRRLQTDALVQWVLHPVEFLEEQRARHGDSFSVRIVPGRPPMVWLSEPEAIRDVFAADDETLNAGEANQIVESVLRKNSILLLDGEPHRRQRKLLMPPFHGDRMCAYGTTMREASARAIGAWRVGGTVTLLDEMQEGIRLRDPAAIREAARKVTMFAEMMDPEHGKVVIASDIGDLGELPSDIIVICDWQVEALAAKLSELVGGWNRWAAMGDRAAAYAKAQFAPPVIGRRLLGAMLV
jgi:hypothetical protein